jgi:hypothetical protein
VHDNALPSKVNKKVNDDSAVADADGGVSVIVA